MAHVEEMYKCERCGQIITVFHGGEGQLVCCGAPMVLLQEKTADMGKEKHVPVVTKKPDGILVSCGEVPHPMEDNHYIEAICIITPDTVKIQKLKPGNKPEAHFCFDSPDVKARAYCNVHGLWTNKA